MIDKDLDSILKDSKVLTTACESLEDILVATENIDDLNTVRNTLEVTKSKLGYNEDVELTTEGISEFVNKIIKTIKEFFSKFWKKVVKYIKKIYKLIITNNNDVEKMSSDLKQKLATERLYDFDKIEIVLPEFLSSISEQDKLELLNYFFTKLMDVKKDIYLTTDSYVKHIAKELNKDEISYVPYKDYFKSKVATNYDNDMRLAKILANLSNIIDDNNGHKYVLGYDNKNIRLYNPITNDISVAPYNKTLVSIYPTEYSNKFLLKHLDNLKELNSFLKKETVVLDTIDNSFNKIKSSMETKLNTGKKEDVYVVSKYVKEITTNLPTLLRTLESCGIVMYSEYKNILSNIYKKSM